MWFTHVKGFTPINSTTLGLAKPNLKPINTWQLNDFVTCFIFHNYVFQWWGAKMLHRLECVMRCWTVHLLMITPQKRLAHKLPIISWWNILWCSNNHVKLNMKIINIIGNINSNFIFKAFMILLKSLSHYCDDKFFAISSPFLF